MKKIYILTLCLAVAITGYLVSPLGISNFDNFAKQTIRDLGHRSDRQMVTNAVLNFIEENEINDPIPYFQRHMDKTIIIKADDLALSDIDRAWLGEAHTLSAFSSSYFNRILTSYNFSVRVRDFPSGEREISARIGYDAP